MKRTTVGFGLVLLMGSGLRADESVPGRPMVPTPALVRRAFERELVRYHRAAWQAHLGGRDVDRFLPGRPVSMRSAAERELLPATVLESYEYYARNVEERDWGSVRVCRAQLAGMPVVITWVSTDGDDGWVEIFDGSGKLVGSGRVYLELLAWEDREVIRAQVGTGDYPPALGDRAVRTLWATPAGF